MFGGMIAPMDRRSLLAGSFAAAATGAAMLAAPRVVFAQAAPPLWQREVLAIAQAQVARASDALWRHDKVGIADFGLHSALRRFHICNLEDGTISSLHVTHGLGSDRNNNGYLDLFSNVAGSLATSRGAYVTQEWYEGRYGTSMRLGGLDASNHNAFDRAIVVHGADYATPAHVARWGQLGRSHGCLAFGPDALREAMGQLWGGRLIYAEALRISPA